MQKFVKKDFCPSYTNKILFDEMVLFIEWYLKKYKKIELSNKEYEDLVTCFEEISKKVFSQEKFFVHRDYHSRNLMIQKSNNPGILDFQDALVGPITYDLVSLLKDAYIEWDEEIVLDHLVRYWEKAKSNNLITNLEFSNFYKDFECMGIQRHLKILGIFARLSIRDKKNQYLENIPLVEKYLMDATERYRDFHQLRIFLGKVIK
jgi:aminoglycoside/choline kinase family phosphotransferase